MILDEKLSDSEITLLMKKYDRPGPRYTSYPTAPMFSKEFGEKQYKEELRRTNRLEDTTDLSPYIHIPFCDTLCYFCGCTSIITKNRERIREYLHYLKQEIELLSSYIASRRKVAQMHWGGGTPTFLIPLEIPDLTSFIKDRFQISESSEISIEIDPRDLTFKHMEALRFSGFSRISMGVQDFNEDVLTAINRNQGEKITRHAIEWSRSLGFSGFNIDLVYGLPRQTIESFEETLDKIIEISPNRIAVYNFAYVPWIKPHQKLIRLEELPTPENKLKILLRTINKFTEAGYIYIGMDHSAKTDDELTRAQIDGTLHRNFQGYSTKAGYDLFGIGMSSISHFASNYAQNSKLLSDYYKAFDAGTFATEVGYQMSSDDQLRKYVIMRLMCDLRLDIQEVEAKYEINFKEYFKESLEGLLPLRDDGLIQLDDRTLQVIKIGRMFLRNIAMCFDAYLSQVQKEKSIYSRTI